MAVALRRPKRPPLAITVVSMIDVMSILLVFFMVTSTYLDLDMIPAVEQSDAAAAPAGPADPAVLLVRVGGDGRPAIRGVSLDDAAFAAAIRERLAAEPLTQVVLLPSGEADLQALVAVMDHAAAAGATRLKVIRLEARP